MTIFILLMLWVGVQAIKWKLFDYFMARLIAKLDERYVKR